MQQNFSERYSRQLRLQGFGEAAQQKLADAKVLVVGAGGLGVAVLQYLAGMGIGHIGIVDDDVVCLSNLHRQVLYAMEDIGQQKAQVAAAKLANLNPGITVQPILQRLNAGNALDILSGYDIVVDATDNFHARYLVNDACVMLGRPFVYGAVQGYEGHVSVFNVERGPTYRCLYPAPPDVTAVADCNAAGVLGVVPGIIGTMQALQVVKLVTGIGQTLSGYLQVYDFLNDMQYKVKLKANPEHHRIAALQEKETSAARADAARFLQPGILAQWRHEGKCFSLVDVREPDEFAAAHIPLALPVPLAEINAAMQRFEKNGPVVLYCQKGGRSAKAFSLLRLQYPDLELYELAGGFDNWINAQQQA